MLASNTIDLVYRSCFAVFFLLGSANAFAQIDSIPATDTVVYSSNFQTDRAAKEAVLHIVRYSGLSPNFIVQQDSDVKNAVAYNKGRKRYIGYNPAFINKVVDNSHTDWAAVSILAHEIGHHLLGHTLKLKHNPGDELAADRYSGFILYRMGATLEEAKAAMEIAGSETGTEKHPPKVARLQAITDGWLEAQAIEGKVAFSESDSTNEESFDMQLTFKGDENIYYVRSDLTVVWYNNYAAPIEIGRITASNDENFLWQYHYSSATFGIDHQGNIWNPTTYGTVFKVGQADKLVTLQPQNEE